MGGWLETAVIYQVYPRSFQDSDGDGIGDLPGITSRLDYLSELGVDGIWLSPIYPSPMADCGYDVTDHSAIAPEYGTDADFARLIDAAHERGIRVLLDIVACHTSIEHPWFREHPERYIWVDADEPPNNWVGAFGGPSWSRDPERPERGLYLHSFFAEQPDLDWRREDVREAMTAMIAGWVERGADGFRVDAIDRAVKDLALRDDPPGAEPFPLPVHPDQQNLDLIYSRDDPEIGLALAALREGAGEKPLIGEVYLPGPRLPRYLDYLDRAFAFDLLHAEWDAEVLAEVLERTAAQPGLAWVTSNHDFSRVASRWGADAVRNAALLLMTLPGCCFVYQGEELGMADGPGRGPDAEPIDRWGRDAFRHPMLWDESSGGGFSSGEPWLPATPAAADGPAAIQQGDPGSVLNLFRALIAARKELAGPVTAPRAAGGLLSFERGGHAVLLNLAAEPRPDPRLAAGRPVLETAPGAIDGDRLQPFSGAILAI